MAGRRRSPCRWRRVEPCERTGAPVYAPGLEVAFPRWPVLEPSFLYGGFPPKALRNKFLFINDVGGYLATLDKAETLTGKCFIPAHAPTVEDNRLPWERA